MNTTAAATLAAALAAASAAHAETDPPIPAPHPVITEVLFHVPLPELGGDANKDGVHRSVGDEFVELYNPHDQPIDVSGYSVSDDHQSERYRLRFVFPEPTVLNPGQTLVVFNGNRQTRDMPEPYGDRRTLAAGPNDAFHGALVYSIKNIAHNRALANHDDMVVLRDRDHNVIDVVVWGKPDYPPQGAPRLAALPNGEGYSWQRTDPWGELVPHIEIDGRRFSPGEIPEAPAEIHDEPGEPR